MPPWGFRLGGGSTPPQPSVSEQLSTVQSTSRTPVDAGAMNPPTPPAPGAPAPVTGNTLQPLPPPAAATTAATAAGGGPTGPPPNSSGHWFWSGTAHQWVDAGGNYDANGVPLTDAQKSYWSNQNHLRASATAIAAANSGPAAPAAPVGFGASDNWHYDVITGMYDVYNPDLKDYEHFTVDQLTSGASEKLKKVAPNWFWAQEAARQKENHYQDILSQSAETERVAGRGNSRYKYQPNYF